MSLSENSPSPGEGLGLGGWGLLPLLTDAANLNPEQRDDQDLPPGLLGFAILAELRVPEHLVNVYVIDAVNDAAWKGAA